MPTQGIVSTKVLKLSTHYAIILIMLSHSSRYHLHHPIPPPLEPHRPKRLHQIHPLEHRPMPQLPIPPPKRPVLPNHNPIRRLRILLRLPPHHRRTRCIARDPHVHPRLNDTVLHQAPGLNFEGGGDRRGVLALEHVA